MSVKYKNALSGRFRPKNPQKYKGDVRNIIYRSGLELRVMKMFDRNPNVLEWSSEETIIPYISPVDGRPHRYFPDFHAKMRQKDGTVKTVIIEVKTSKETKEPERKSKITQRYLNEVVTWGQNRAKWDAAYEWCADRGYDFQIITEEDLGITYK